MISDLKKTFMWKTEAADDFIIMQFFNININITVELSAYLYAVLCSKIAVKINEHLIQTFLNTESEINMMNCKIVKVCGISIHCEITFEMQTADSGKTPFYSCAENIKMKMTGIISTFFIFVTEGVENELILEHLWEQVIEINIFSWADESVEWTICSFKKKIVFLNYLSEIISLCTEKNIFSATLN